MKYFIYNLGFWGIIVGGNLIFYSPFSLSNALQTWYLGLIQQHFFTLLSMMRNLI